MNTWDYKLYKEFRKQQEISAAEYFRSKHHTLHPKYSFILEKRDDWDKNIILESVYNYIIAEHQKRRVIKKSFPIHKYIHHGLSSQAMLFNLLGDALIKNDLPLFQNIFNFKDVIIDKSSEIKFEHSDRDTFNEKSQQPTSFDFTIINKSSKNIFLEAKYVETEFGKCSTIETGECDGLNPANNPDLCYLTYKKKNYWEIMKKYGLEKIYSQSPICPFAIYYQFFRELLFAAENNGYYAILIDKRNPAFEKTGTNGKRGLIPVLREQLPQNLKDIIKVLYIQEILDILEKEGYTWIGEFKLKYGI